MDIGRDVMMDSYTQYLQQVRKTKTGLTDFLWQETFHLEGRRTRRNITNTISDTKVLSFLTNTPKNTHLLLGILWLKCLKVRVRPLSKMYVFKMIFFPFNNEICMTVISENLWETVPIPHRKSKPGKSELIVRRKMISLFCLCHSQAANGVVALLAKAFKKRDKEWVMLNRWHCEWRWKAAEV